MSHTPYRQYPIGEILTELLESEGLSEAEFARRTGLAQPMINRLARRLNNNPKVSTLAPIAKYFNVTFSQLLGEDPLPIKTVINLKLQDINDNTKLSEQIFSLKIIDQQYEPRFPQGSVLVFKTINDLNLNNNAIILIKEKNKIAELYQLKIEENKIYSLFNNTVIDVNDLDQCTMLALLAEARYAKN